MTGTNEEDLFFNRAPPLFYNFFFCVVVASILKLGISALPITMNTKPIKTQKNDDANKLAETTCCIPYSSTLKYRATTHRAASRKHIIPTTNDIFCRTLVPFFMILPLLNIELSQYNKLSTLTIITTEHVINLTSESRLVLTVLSPGKLK